MVVRLGERGEAPVLDHAVETPYQRNVIVPKRPSRAMSPALTPYSR